MKSRILSLAVAMTVALGSTAASVETDREWYLAGEAMQVGVTVDDALIAYAELCDTRGLAAATVIGLAADGTGTGTIELPPTLHSGYYVLSVYTRDRAEVESRLVAIVNPLRKSIDDDIEWIGVTQPDSLSRPSHQGGFTLELAGRKQTDERETEGHIIKTRVRHVYDGQTYKGSEVCPSLSIVGRQVHYFEGRMVDDSTAVFYTFGVEGRQALVLSALTSTGVSLPIEMVSPYAGLTPKRLPRLVFHYQRNEVEARSLDMQRHQAAIAPAEESIDKLGERQGTGLTTDYDNTVGGTKPDLSYNLDEYRQFFTVREVLTEYVKFISKKKINGVTKLVVNTEQDYYNNVLPALVLIDGTPVYDTERLLRYDARRIHYINIYSGQYTFGNGAYNGILSFVTRSGRLTNFPTDPNAQYLVYDFPAIYNVGGRKVVK